MSARPFLLSAPTSASQRGLTLVELMVGLVVLAMLMAGLSQLVVTNSKNANATGNLARVEDSGRTALQLLSADIRRSGHFGGNAVNHLNVDFEMVTGSLGIPDNLDTISCDTATNEWARQIKQPLVGIDGGIDGDPAPAYDCITLIGSGEPGEYLQGDVLVLRYATGLASPPAYTATRPYLRTTPVEGRIFTGAQQGAMENLITHPATRTYELVAHAYYVGNTQRSCQSQPIPALFRIRVNDNGRPETQELLAGVEQLQFRYLLDNAYVDAAAIAPPDWVRVQAVEATVLARAECPEPGFTSNTTYDFAGEKYPAAPDSYRRKLFSATVQLRNR